MIEAESFGIQIGVQNSVRILEVSEVEGEDVEHTSEYSSGVYGSTVRGEVSRSFGGI